MKNLFFTFMVCVIGLSACMQNNNYKDPLKTKSNSDYFEEAKELKGIGEFIIDKSTYSDVLSILKKQDDGYSIREIKYDTLPKNLENNFLTDGHTFDCPKLKLIRKYEYKIGKIELRSLYFHFYNDTLYEVFMSQNDQVEEGFKKKYGPGLFTDNTQRKINGDLIKIDKTYLWQNSNVIAESRTLIEYEKGGTSLTFLDIKTKNSVKLKNILDCQNTAFALKEKIQAKAKQADIDKL